MKVSGHSLESSCQPTANESFLFYIFLAPQVGVTKGQPEEMVSTEAPNQPESSELVNYYSSSIGRY